MKARKLLIFLLCFVLVIASVAVIAAAQGATETESYTEVTNDDGTVTTKYGTIPSTYADSATYPFVLFKYKDGELSSDVVGYATMKEAFNAARGYQQYNVWDAENGEYNDIEYSLYSSKIVLRRDYTTTASDKFDNYAQTQGEIILDLNGYTLTQGDSTSGLFYQVTTKGWSGVGEKNEDKDGVAEDFVFETEYTVINGDIAVKTNPVFYGNMWNSVYSATESDYIYSMANKDFIWNFDNVTFKYVSGATETSMLMGYTGPQSLTSNPPDVAAPFTFNYTDCTFDLTNAPNGTVTLFNAAPGSETNNYYLKIGVNVVGCEIIAPARVTANLKLYTVESNHNSGSYVTFAADENGDVLTLTLPEDETPAAPTASTYVTIDGKQLYWHNVDGVYVLTECADSETNHACSCGTIYTACSDADSDNLCDDCGAYNAGGTWISDENASAYPFAILDASGAYSSLQTTWKNATNAAKAIDGSTIVLLRDYTNVASDTNNLKDFGVEFTVDLNGYTLTRGYSGAYLFDNWWDASTTSDTVKVTFKNGTLNAEKWLICLSGSDAIANAKQADFVFEDVTFKFAAKNDQNYGWIFEVHSQTYNKQITTNITFTDCTFDTTDMRSSITMTAAPALNLDVNNKSGVDYVKATVTFNGGKIIANRFATYALYQVHADDTVTFGKGTDGEYLVLEMEEGTAPETPTSSDYITVDGIAAYFHKSGDVYVLSECLDSATNHECTCGVFYSDCTDENKDHTCDVCGETSECIDEDKNHVCDLCEKELTCAELDKDVDHVCDSCGEEFACTDANKDEICDHCGYVINDYGIKNIPATYASTDTYPFFVLKLVDGEYSFASACKTFYGSQSGSSAMGYAIYSVLRDANRYDLETGEYVPQQDGGSVVTAVVVMRRDYDLKSGTEYHNNMAHMQGTTILDLGGHTLREASGSTKSLIYITAKGWTGNPDKDNGYNDFTFPSTLTITNGRMEVLKYAAATICTNDVIEATEGWYIKNSAYTVNFDGVTFGLASGATATSLVYTNGSTSNSYDGVAKVNVNVTNCVFDLETNAVTTAITIINNDTTGKDVDCDVVIEGCKILSSDMSKVTVYKSSTTNGSSTVVKKDGNGSYVTLVMPTGSTAPAVTNTVVIDNGAVCAFVKTSVADGNDNYVLYPAVMVGYKIKTSVTLYSNFVYNIYIPTANFNKATVDENAAEYEEVMVDGVSYYLVKVELPAGEALSDIALTVTLNSGETTVDASWTLSVLNYAKSVVNGSFDDTTKTLMKDMLVYASAAHTYFDNELDSAKAAEVALLTDGYTKDMPTGEAKKPTDKTYFTDVAVYLGEVPSFRFYLADGYTIDNFTFKVGEKDATVKSVEEEIINEDESTTTIRYVEVTMYAYMMLDDVTFTVNGTEVTESYNLYSYYAYSKTLNNNANLVNLVEALMKYSASAEDYREYYLATHCIHNYVDGKCTKCGEDDPDVGTMTLNAPTAIYSNYAGKDISVTFSKDWYNKEVTYTTDNENVFVENGKIYATGTFSSAVDVTVTATTEDHTATATVNVSTFVGDGRNVSAETKVQWYENNIIKEENKGGMIFVGDSYFDGAGTVPAFWRDFYEDYAGEKAFLMGISSSQIGDLEVVSERLVYPMEPSEIVVHIGFNDVHSGSLTTDELIERITALVTEYHEKLPNAKIYYCGVEPKKGGYDSTSSFYSSSTERAPALTAAMQALSEANDWFVYVDTLSIFVRNYGTEDAAVNNNMYYLTDASHPTLHAYDLMRFMIDEARGKETDVIRLFDSAEQITGVTSVTAGGVYLTDNNGAAITTATGDFVISGKLAITNLMLSNAHIQFRFKSGSRFLLWDKDSDGIFYANGASASTEKFDANESIVLDWAVVVQSGVAYLYIDGNLEATLEVPDIQEFNIGVSHLDLTLYDVSFSATTDADYSTHMEKYSGERIYVENYSGATAIANTGTTYTADLDGNALTGNYVMRGSLEIYKLKLSNAHLQFNFGNSYRFLLWDNDKDGYFGAGYQTPDGHTNETVTGELYHAKSGVLTLDWAIVVKDGTAYWYINGELVCTFAGENLDFSSVLVGAVCMNVLIYDVEIYAEEGNSENYNAVASEYLD